MLSADWHNSNDSPDQGNGSARTRNEFLKYSDKIAFLRQSFLLRRVNAGALVYRIDWAATTGKIALLDKIGTDHGIREEDRSQSPHLSK
jgi:hypothetical protein